jgi:hypothetical protein
MTVLFSPDIPYCDIVIYLQYWKYCLLLIYLNLKITYLYVILD